MARHYLVGCHCSKHIKCKSVVGSVQVLIYDFIVNNTWDCWKDKSNVWVLEAAGPSLYSSPLTGTMTPSALYHCQKKTICIYLWCE